jgi:aspartokinase/homoserine dehydrogenase 1
MVLQRIRESMADNQKNYLYETNVGAGLPYWHHKIIASSVKNITKKRGFQELELFVQSFS